MNPPVEERGERERQDDRDLRAGRQGEVVRGGLPRGGGSDRASSPGDEGARAEDDRGRAKAPPGAAAADGPWRASRARALPPSSETPEVLPAREGYDRWAEIYDEDDNPLVALEGPRVAELLGDVRGLRIADVGCGTGRHAEHLAAAGAQVVALDFSASMLRHARAKPGAKAVHFVRHDLTAPLPFPAATFDRAICCLVMDHIPDPGRLLAELRRVVKRDGFVLVSVMHPAMMLKGVQARFTDSATGRQVRPQSFPHQLADYVMAMARAGLAPDHLSEHPVDDDLAARLPRARKYLGWPLLFLARLRPAGAGGASPGIDEDCRNPLQGSL